MIPKLTDLVLYINKALSGEAWNSNWQKIITWLTGGTTDIKVNSVETNTITTSGALKGKTLEVTEGAQIGQNLTVGGIISGNGSGLTNIRSTSTIAYTPFTVNSAYIDTTTTSPTYGKEIPMYKETGYDNLIKFNVNTNFPLIATTSDGVTFKLELLDDLDVSDTGDGTYVVCVKKGQQRAELKEGANGVYRQRLAPTDVSIPNNSLWLDTSKENIQCYERLNNDWTTKYDGVPLGEVVVSGGEVSSITIYHYNWNGYNINNQEQINITQRPAVIIESWYADNINWGTRQTQCDSYIKYSNGFVVQSGRISWESGSANKYNDFLPLAITLSKVCSVSLTSTELTDSSESSGTVTQISGGSVKVIGEEKNFSHAGTLLWEVKGYI